VLLLWCGGGVGYDNRADWGVLKEWIKERDDEHPPVPDCCCRDIFKGLRRNE
jgi:hypothetical protein